MHRYGFAPEPSAARLHLSARAIEAQMRQRIERLLANMDVVTREEFEVVRELAANARREQEALSKTVAALERRIAALEGGAPKAAVAKQAAIAAPKRPATAKPRKPARKSESAKKDDKAN